MCEVLRAFHYPTTILDHWEKVSAERERQSKKFGSADGVFFYTVGI